MEALHRGEQFTLALGDHHQSWRWGPERGSESAETGDSLVRTMEAHLATSLRMAAEWIDHAESHGDLLASHRRLPVCTPRRWIAMTAECQSTPDSYSKGPELSGCGNEDQADAWLRQRGTAWFRPILARTTTVYRPLGPFAYDCVKLIVVRDGSAILYSRYFGERHIKPGDAILLGPGVLCGSEPEAVSYTHLTLPTILLV